MIHAIVYAKWDGVLDFYESTPHFPEEYLPQIESICQQVGVGFVPGQQNYALRYAPLQDRYMLNVMLRNPGGGADEHRVHWNVLTFLLDAAEADRLFLLSYHDIRDNALAVSRALLGDFRKKVLPVELVEELLTGKARQERTIQSRIPAHVLMTAALYSKKESDPFRLFIQVPDDPAQELDLLLSSLPPLLRKDISFHSGVYFPEDSFGVSICCCTAPVLERLEATGFNGCEPGNIYYHYSGDVGRKNRVDERYTRRMQDLQKLHSRVMRYDILQFAISDWDTYLKMADVVHAKNALRETFRLLQDRDLENALEYARKLKLEPLSQVELKRFLAVSGGKPEMKRTLRSQRTEKPWLPLALPILEKISIAGALPAVLLQMDIQSEPALWKSILSLLLMLAAGCGLRGLLDGFHRPGDK